MLIQEGKVKEKYIININTIDNVQVDSNLDSIIKRIKKGITSSKDFNYEICVIMDGYYENSRITEVIDTFLHDIMDESSCFCFISKNDDQCSEYITAFIKKIFSTYGKKMNADLNDERLYRLDVVRNISGKEFFADFFVPKSRISDKEYDEFLNLGPDYLTAHLLPDEIITYVLPYLYMRLSEYGLLKNNELRDIKKYKIGMS